MTTDPINPEKNSRRFTIMDGVVLALAVCAFAAPFAARLQVQAHAATPQVAVLSDVTPIRQIDIDLGHNEQKAEAAFYEGLQGSQEQDNDAQIDVALVEPERPLVAVGEDLSGSQESDSNAQIDLAIVAPERPLAPVNADRNQPPSLAEKAEIAVAPDFRRDVALLFSPLILDLAVAADTSDEAPQQTAKVAELPTEEAAEEGASKIQVIMTAPPTMTPVPAKRPFHAVKKPITTVLLDGQRVSSLVEPSAPLTSGVIEEAALPPLEVVDSSGLPLQEKIPPVPVAKPTANERVAAKREPVIETAAIKPLAPADNPPVEVTVDTPTPAEDRPVEVAVNTLPIPADSPQAEVTVEAPADNLQAAVTLDTPPTLVINPPAAAVTINPQPSPVIASPIAVAVNAPQPSVVEPPQAITINSAVTPVVIPQPASAVNPRPPIAEPVARPITVATRAPEPARPVTRITNGPRIALVIAAAGLNENVTRFAIDALPAGVTLAFAPIKSEAGALAREAKQDGHTVLVEIPMESRSRSRDLGPLTLRVADSSSENIDRLNRALAKIPVADGASSYLGSRFNAEERAVAPVVNALASRNLMFFENEPSSRSVFRGLSGRANLPYARGSVKIDRDRSAAAIREALDDLEIKARARGSAIGVGTALRSTISTVALWAKEAEKRGVRLVPIIEVAR